MPNPNDPIEAEDYERLAVQVFRQLVDDYCHLQDPGVRKRPEARKAFITAMDMVWDDEYRLLHFLNDDQLPMTLEEFLCITSDRGNVDIEAFRRYLTQAANDYYNEKNLDMFKVPEIIMVCGVPYNILSRKEDATEIDYEDRIIYINDTEINDLFFQQLFSCLMEIVCFHKDLRMSASARRDLAYEFFNVIRLNRIIVAD